MNQIVNDFVKLVTQNKGVNTKEKMIDIVRQKFDMVNDGKALYHTHYFVVVFCYRSGKSFSNVVLSLSKLEKYDRIPCFVVLVRKDLDNIIYMINSTFIDKVSHSSKKLRIDNIRGSFLGNNIRKEIAEIDKKNDPNDFDELFAYHQAFSWEENLERLVERTNNIKPKKVKVLLTPNEQYNIFKAPERAKKFIASEDYNTLRDDLRHRCEQVKDAILAASHVDNVNIRGRLIEALITSDNEERHRLLKELADIENLLPTYDTKNDLGDYVRKFDNADSYTDIKTKVLYRKSTPKAYNIDKFLECMGQEKSVFMFFFVGIDETGIINTALVSVFHTDLQEKTSLQHHWAGKAARGSAQFNGKIINELLNKNPFTNEIDEKKSTEFLKKLIDR